MIDSNSIRKNLEKLSFPRLSGTKEENLAFNIIKKDIDELNLPFSIQEFVFSTFYSRVYPRIAFSLAFWLLFIIFLNIEGYFKQITLISVGIAFVILFLFVKNPERLEFGRVLPSQNLVVKYPSKKKENTSKGILLFAHLDSKGQRLSISIRIWTIRIWLTSYVIAMIVIILYYIIFLQIVSWLYIIGAIFVGINFFTTFLFMINTTNNKSYGALDNASGVVSVLELLNYYLNPELRLKNYNLWFVFTGAEECGTMGIRHFCNECGDLDKTKSIIINFDSIGKSLAYFSSSINPNKNINLYNTFQKSAEKLNLRFHYKKSSFGIRSDGLYLKSQGFRGFGFGDLEIYKYVHSVNDTIDKVDTNLLKKLCIFITDILKEVDDHILDEFSC